MALMDEFKKERNSIKDASLKKKIEYLWQYYKWHFIGPIIIVFVIGIFIHTSMNAKESYLYAMFFNVETGLLTDNDISQDFLSYVEKDPEEYTVTIDTDYYMGTEHPQAAQTTYQKLSIFTNTNQLDILGGPISSMNMCIYDAYLRDLRGVLTEEEMELYEPYLLYADEAILNEKIEAEMNSEIYEFDYPDPTKPETMEIPVPIAIDISKCEKTKVFYDNPSEMIAVGVAVSTLQAEHTREYIQYLFQ